MGRAPCCDKANVKKGPWSPEEDAKLKAYIDKYGTGGNWIALPQKIGLKRCGKSCRLRWLNYLRPNIKHGSFTEEEDNIILNLYISIGSRWSIIAAQLPGRTDNDIKNYWNTRLKKKLLGRRKQQQQHLNGSKDEPPTLSSSALERLQLHMQLHSQHQFQHNSFSFSLFNNPALLPKLHPLLQEKLMQSNLHNLNHQIHHPCNNPINLLQYNNNNNNDNNNNKCNMENSSLNGSTSSEISNVVNNNNNDDANNNNMIRNNLILDGCNSGGLGRVRSFQAELDQLLGNEFERMSGWWSHDSNSSVNASNVNVQSENVLYQDYGN